MTKQEREEHILRTAFSVFVENKIEGSTFNMIADEANVGVATLYRHYIDKIDLAIKVCGVYWHDFILSKLENRSLEEIANIPAIERLSYTLDMYIDLYTNHKDLLIYNDNFNHYIAHEHVEPERLVNYNISISAISERFHLMYEKAKIDKTMRTDYSEEYMLRVTLHTMMGACNHYAGGIVWGGNINHDYTKELQSLKDMIMKFAAGK